MIDSWISQFATDPLKYLLLMAIAGLLVWLGAGISAFGRKKRLPKQRERHLEESIAALEASQIEIRVELHRLSQRGFERPAETQVVVLAVEDSSREEFSFPVEFSEGKVA